MALYTKSIKAAQSTKDGIRICIMRRIRPHYKFDIWIPALAPSEEFLTAYQKKKMDWKEYELQFSKILEKQKHIVEILAEMASSRNVTILCAEATPAKCHRRLVAKECKKHNPKLKIILK